MSQFPRPQMQEIGKPPDPPFEDDKAKVDALLAENQRLRGALEQIAAEWDGNLGTGQMLTDFCREALAGDAE